MNNSLGGKEECLNSTVPEIRDLLIDAERICHRKPANGIRKWMSAVFHRIVLRAWIPAILLLVCIMSCRMWPIGSHPAVFSFSVSCAAGIVCWCFLDLIPSFRLREWYRNYLATTYRSVRESIVTILFDSIRFTIDECDPKTRDVILNSLVDFASFRKFFHTGENSPLARSVQNWTSETVQDIYFHFNELAHAIETTVDNCPWVGEPSHYALRHICHFIRERQNLSFFQIENDKYVLEYLLVPIMANWSLIEGAMSEDPIQKAIDQL